MEVENYNFYARVFSEKPKKSCDKCKTFSNTPITGRTKEMKDIHLKHIQEKDLTRDQKATLKLNAKDEENVLVAAFDLEKVLLCPHTQISSFCYCKHLKLHNYIN